MTEKAENSKTQFTILDHHYINMGIIAVAGGTGGIGRALVDAIVVRGKHEVKILSRKVGVTTIRIL